MIIKLISSDKICAKQCHESEGGPGGLCKNLCEGGSPYSAIKNLGGFLPKHKRWTERVLNELFGIDLM